MTKQKSYVKTFTDAAWCYFALIEAAIESSGDNPKYQEGLRLTLAEEKHNALTKKGWRAPRSGDLRHINLWNGRKS